jgi:hypothetical protein
VGSFRALRREVGVDLLHADVERAPVAFSQEQLVVPVDQRRGDARRIGEDVLDAVLHQRARREVLRDAAEHGDAGHLEAQGHVRGLEHVAGGVDEDQPVDPRRRRGRHAPGHLAAQRVAADGEALHVQGVEEVEREAGQGVDAVVVARVLAGERPGKAESGQVERDDALAGAQLAGPALPRVQAGGGAVQQHQRRGIGLRALVAKMHELALDVHEI